jgi:hypothetical protein
MSNQQSVTSNQAHPDSQPLSCSGKRVAMNVVGDTSGSNVSMVLGSPLLIAES